MFNSNPVEFSVSFNESASLYILSFTNISSACLNDLGLLMLLHFADLLSFSVHLIAAVSLNKLMETAFKEVCNNTNWRCGHRKFSKSQKYSIKCHLKKSRVSGWTDCNVGLAWRQQHTVQVHSDGRWSVKKAAAPNCEVVTSQGLLMFSTVSKEL